MVGFGNCLIRSVFPFTYVCCFLQTRSLSFDTHTFQSLTPVFWLSFGHCTFGSTRICSKLFTAGCEDAMTNPLAHLWNWNRNPALMLEICSSDFGNEQWQPIHEYIQMNGYSELGCYTSHGEYEWKPLKTLWLWGYCLLTPFFMGKLADGCRQKDSINSKLSLQEM